MYHTDSKVPVKPRVKKKSKMKDFPVNDKSMWLGQMKEQSYSNYLKKGEKSFSEAQNMTKIIAM